ncbi:mammalian cell entry protein [Mycolicibacterium grossiae]|nr:mammalian cell entry protein [Mycolicibacterium grossiae]
MAPSEAPAETVTPEPAAAEPAAKSTTAEPQTAEPTTTRRRFGWGRKKAAPAAPVVTETPDAVPDPSPLDTTPASTAPADTTPVDTAPVDTTSAEDVAAAPADETETDVVTTAAVADTTVAPEADDVDPVSTEDAESTETAETSEAPESAATSEADEAPEPVLVPHRTAGRALKVAAAAAGVLVVGAAAFAGAALQPYLADRAEVQTKFEIAKVSADAITTLWTYTPEDMDSLPDRAARYLGGDFATDYRRYIDSIVSTNKQAQVSNVTQVMGTAVEDLSPTEATALVYTNSVATSPVTKGIPSLRYLSYRLGLRLEDRKWRITQMQAVTSLDLTPRL